jgi:hypothetical protein
LSRFPFPASRKGNEQADDERDGERFFRKGFRQRQRRDQGANDHHPEKDADQPKQFAQVQSDQAHVRLPKGEPPIHSVIPAQAFMRKWPFPLPVIPLTAGIQFLASSPKGGTRHAALRAERKDSGFRLSPE